MTAADLRTLRDQIDGLRGGSPFDYIVGGARPQSDPRAERRYVQSMAKAGATWWTLWIPPCEPAEARRTIANRLPQIDST